MSKALLPSIGIVLVLSTSALGQDEAAQARLFDAAEKGDLASVRQLLDNGANPNAQKPGKRLALGIVQGNLGVVETQDPRGWTALGIAVSRDDLQLVDLLLTKGADPNTQFFVSTSAQSLEDMFLTAGPLHPLDAAEQLATAKASGKPIKLDLGNGHFIEIDSKEARAMLSTKGVPSWMVQKARESLLTTALILAAQRNQPSIVSRLLSAGADVNAKDEKGDTALIHAQRSKSVEVEQLLRR